MRRRRADTDTNEVTNTDAKHKDTRAGVQFHVWWENYKS